MQRNLPYLVISLFILLLAPSVSGQLPRTAEERAKWNTTGRACGSVRAVDYKQVGEQSWQASQKEVKKATIRLYRRDTGRPCCEESELVGKRVLDRHGTFSFERELKGKYWITIETPDRKGKGAINLNPADKETTCSKQSFIVDKKGNVDVGREVIIRGD